MKYSVYIIVFLGLMIASCKKNDAEFRTQFIGHAGSGMSQWNGMYAPNSLESIQYALRFDKCSGVEVDARISLDTTFWLFHDDNLSHSTNQTGCVANMYDKELQDIHLKTIHQEKLTTLNQLLALNSSKEIIIDLKQYNTCTNAVVDFDFIKKGFQKLTIQGQNVKIKMNSASIYPYLKDLHIPLILEVESVQEATSLFNQPNIDGFMFSASKITKSEIETLHQLGYKVYLYEVRSGIRLKKERLKNPDYILVDDLVNSITTL
jgi:glycerophosphoryl diester phosphodiesterase